MLCIKRSQLDTHLADCQMQWHADAGTACLMAKKLSAWWKVLAHTPRQLGVHALCKVFTVHTTPIENGVSERVTCTCEVQACTYSGKQQQQWCCVGPGVAVVRSGRGHGAGGAAVQHAIKHAAVQEFAHACIDQHQ